MMSTILQHYATVFGCFKQVFIEPLVRNDLGCSTDFEVLLGSNSFGQLVGFVAHITGPNELHVAEL